MYQLVSWHNLKSAKKISPGFIVHRLARCPWIYAWSSTSTLRGVALTCLTGRWTGLNLEPLKVAGMPWWTSSWHGQLVPTGSFGWCCDNHGWPGTMFQGAWCSWWISPLTCTVYPQRHLTSTYRALVPISEARYISQPLLACLGSGSRSCNARGVQCRLWIAENQNSQNGGACCRICVDFCVSVAELGRGFWLSGFWVWTWIEVALFVDVFDRFGIFQYKPQ